MYISSALQPKFCTGLVCLRLPCGKNRKRIRHLLSALCLKSSHCFPDQAYPSSLFLHVLGNVYNISPKGPKRGLVYVLSSLNENKQYFYFWKEIVILSETEGIFIGSLGIILSSLKILKSFCSEIVFLFFYFKCHQ